MSDLRALLLTDVVDSTKLTEALGDAAMAVLWAAHDRAARDLLPEWRGREIDKTDGMLLLFDTAADALGYALAYHRALAALKLPFLARAGLHVGPVSLRSNPADDVARGAKLVEVDGLALPVAARVMSVALGGQTLLSADARIALGITPRRVLSHGHWRLQGVADPVELFEVGETGAPFTAPPDAGKAYRVARQGELWVPLREVKHSLPAERDSFVGRQEPLRQLAAKLEDGARLVSVLGMGGTGKTRLVTRFAWSWLGEFPGGVWFCDLSQARTLDGIFFAVAQGLDVPLGKTDPAVQLAHAINGRGKCLVILDNFEQVVRHAEETLGRWLDRAVHAKFIVTTREVLGIVGEETFALAPLPPSDAAMLFLRRAEAARQGYQANADDVAAIEQLVGALDGLPLAIELAAARVRVMPPATLLAMMNERFKVLRSAGGRNDRRATLRAAFDWSWELLSEAEKAALAQLSVFEGGFTLMTAEAVLDLSASEDAYWTMDVVQLLVDKSFVRQVADDRFNLLESVREYAAEHLRTAGRYVGSGPLARIGAERRHGAFFASLDPKIVDLPSGIELDNMITACRRAVVRHDGGIAAKALSAVWRPLRLRGPFQVGVELSRAVRAMKGLDDYARVESDLVGGIALQLCGSITEAKDQLTAASTGARRLGLRELEVRALQGLAMVQAQSGLMDEANTCYEIAMNLVRESDDPALRCGLLNGLGSFRESLGRAAEARDLYAAGLALARASGERRWEGGSAGNLGQCHANLGNLAQARPLYAQAVLIARELGDRQWEANARCNLGLLHHAEGEFAEARTELEAALLAAREMGHARLLAIVQCNLGLVALALEQPADALACFEAALAIACDLGDRRSEGQFLTYLGLLHARQGRFDTARDCLNVGEPWLRAASDQISLGILLCARAELEHRAANPRCAEMALAEASSVAAQLTELQPDSEFGQALRRVRELVTEPA